MSYPAKELSLAEQLAGHAYEWAAVRGDQVLAIAASYDDLLAAVELEPTDAVMIIPPEVGLAPSE